MKRILKSVLVISLVITIGYLGTRAYFSDTEEIKGNSITAGTIDIAVDESNPWENTDPYVIEDMKPGGHTEYIDFEITNVGENPANIWKRVTVVDTDTGIVSEPECTDQNGTWNGYEGNPACDFPDDDDLNDMQKYLSYDMTIDEEELIPAEWEIMIGDIDGVWIPLGYLEPGESMDVVQSYHLDEQAGNEYQGDIVYFDMTLYAEQYMGDGPVYNPEDGPGGLVLENKDLDPHWRPIIDDIWGLLTWDASGDYRLRAWGLDDSLDFNVAYWSGSSEIGISGSYSPSGGELDFSENYGGFGATDAKYWLRPDNYDNAETLWESNLVN